MPSWKDLGGVLTTLREIDIERIRRESEKPLVMTCVGSPPLLNLVTELLHVGPTPRYQPVSANPLHYVNPPFNVNRADFNQTDLLLFVIDGRQRLAHAEVETFNHLEALALPLLVVVLYSDRLPEVDSGEISLASGTVRTIALPDPSTPNAHANLATALFDLVPGELRLAAARQLPGLRPPVAHDLITSTAFSNAAYTLASGLPEQIPIISVPFAAADILVLTKNQALLVYKLALCHGAPPEFQERIREVLPVIGGGYFWRQMARSLVGLIPIWGLIPKIAVAYAGTYTTGVVAWRWYASNEVVSGNQLKQVMREAKELGWAQARRLFAQTAKPAEEQSGRIRGFLTQRGWLPGSQKQSSPEE